MKIHSEETILKAQAMRDEGKVFDDITPVLGVSHSWLVAHTHAAKGARIGGYSTKFKIKAVKYFKKHGYKYFARSYPQLSRSVIYLWLKKLDETEIDKSENCWFVTDEAALSPLAKLFAGMNDYHFPDDCERMEEPL